MWRFCAGAIAALMLLPAVRAQEDTEKKAKEGVEQKAEPQTPAEKYRALVTEHSEAMNSFMAEYRSATTSEERAKLVQEKYPKPDEYADKFLELYKEHADDPIAEQALSWIFRYASATEAAGTAAKTVLEQVAKDLEDPEAMSKLTMIARMRNPQAEEARKMLMEHFVDNEEFKTVCFSLDNDALRQVIEKTTNRAVKGHAMVALGRSLLGRPVQPNEEGEQLLAKVVEEYADIDSFRGKLGAMAEGPLFELNHLQIGMLAPNIKGTDVDDEAFELEDYRGKVVVLDFWGDW